MEVYFEKNVISESVENKNKTITVFKALKYVCLALLIVALYYNLFIKDLSRGSKGLPYVLFLIFTSVLELSLPIVGFLVFNKLFARASAEYDYFIFGSTFRIIRITNRNKRKRILEMPVDSIGAIGVMGSDSYNRYKSDNKIKILNAYCNDANPIAYFYVSQNGERKLINVEIDAEFIVALKKSLNHGVISKEINDLYKKLTETAQ